MMMYNDGGTAVPSVFRDRRARRVSLRGGETAEGGGAFADRD